MAFVLPQFTRNQVNKAGKVLVAPEEFSDEEQEWAALVLANWRAVHGYPMNTFQATLRHKLKNGYGDTIVAQRLKRAPSIIAKLQRFEGMQLARMQDIGGLRAVLSSVARVRRLEEEYRASPFKHELTNSKDYIEEPKSDGYRSVHLIYRYQNKRASAYSGLSLELQFRTRLQHAWATAVETMGTFLGQALKAGQGEKRWREFFTKASAAIAVLERTTPVPGFEGMTREEVFSDVANSERQLQVLHQLQGFAVVAEHIMTERGQGSYHLIILDSVRRTVTLKPFPMANLAEANLEYAQIEQRTKNGEPVEAVLVSAGPISALRKAYPNYFLDTQAFVSQMQAVINEAEGASSARRPRKARK